MLQLPVNWVKLVSHNPRWLLIRVAIFGFVSICLVLTLQISRGWSFQATQQHHILYDDKVENITRTSLSYAEPIQSPYKHQFWEVGKRLKQVNQWLLDLSHSPSEQHYLEPAIESVIGGLFPFLLNSSRTSPLKSLRDSFQPDSRGIVIPVGGGENAIRFAGHLITSLRNVLGCELPIQVAYAGDSDLSVEDRKRIMALPAAEGVAFLDVLSVFDDSTLKLAEGGWAVKAFAALAADFEQVIVLDADAVFLQKPEVLFEQPGYVQHGAQLFHDRLLWQHVFTDRREWFVDQIKEPSAAMNKSLVWTEDYAEECDSGVVVLDKSRTDVLMGLLHIAWQNTYEVREEVTYKITYGDKESWWLGLELAGSGYEFEAHYGSMLGWEMGEDDDMQPGSGRVCSFVIAHTDADENLIWYNGSLLKNKLKEPELYEVPEVWMMDGEWVKGQTKAHMSCMVKDEVKQLTLQQKLVLQQSIRAAKLVDNSLKATISEEF